MGWTRRQFISGAFEELGLAAYVFDMTPEQFQSAARRLDSMLLEWNARGLRLGPNISGSVDGADLDTDMGLPDMANEAVITNLAIRLAPSYGKTPSPDTKATARGALNTVYARLAQPVEMQLPTGTPLGAGNKPWRFGNPFVVPPADPVAVGPDSNLTV
jgi:hypothetical protein